MIGRWTLALFPDLKRVDSASTRWELWRTAYAPVLGSPVYWLIALVTQVAAQVVLGLTVTRYVRRLGIYRGFLEWGLPLPLIYAVLAIAGSWVYPLLTVHLPHHHYGDSPWTQTGTLRGQIIPALFLELTYHLEHHLYPAVPSHHLPELSRRLEPYARAAGVRPRRVP